MDPKTVSADLSAGVPPERDAAHPSREMCAVQRNELLQCDVAVRLTHIYRSNFSMRMTSVEG